MTIKKAYHVVVIGGGITGLSAAFHLKKNGISRIAISQSETLGSPSRLASGFCSGGQLDNFTRLSHLHGTPLAHNLWEFGNHAFDAVGQFANDHKLPFIRSRRCRFLASDAELSEGRAAVLQLASCGFSETTLEEHVTSHHLRIRGVQTDGNRGAYIDSEALYQSLLKTTSSIPRIAPIKRIEREQDSLVLVMENEQSIRTEVAIVAAHIGTGNLVPEIQSALVTFADQWTEFALPEGALPDWFVPGLAFTTNHTYEWGVVVNRTKLHFGGGRYLRPLAGIESIHPYVDPRITSHLKTQLSQTISGLDPNQIVASSTYGLLDVRPCDELPIVGPMFGEPRLLIGTGFSGQGVQMGFYAGSLLADLVAKGNTMNLPRAIWPERLRSLPET